MTTLLRLLPQFFHLIGFRIALILLFKKNPGLMRRLAPIEGKRFLLHATDIQKKYPFLIAEGEVKVLWGGVTTTPDVTMRGDFQFLLDLLYHRVDADSLFFSRKLVVEGNIQTSIYFKNFLENI